MNGINNYIQNNVKCEEPLTNPWNILIKLSEKKWHHKKYLIIFCMTLSFNQFFLSWMIVLNTKGQTWYYFHIQQCNIYFQAIKYFWSDSVYKNSNIFFQKVNAANNIDNPSHTLDKKIKFSFSISNYKCFYDWPLNHLMCIKHIIEIFCSK